MGLWFGRLVEEVCLDSQEWFCGVRAQTYDLMDEVQFVRLPLL